MVGKVSISRLDCYFITLQKKQNKDGLRETQTYRVSPAGSKLNSSSCRYYSMGSLMYVCEHEEEMGGSVTRTRRNLVYISCGNLSSQSTRRSRRLKRSGKDEFIAIRSSLGGICFLRRPVRCSIHMVRQRLVSSSSSSSSRKVNDAKRNSLLLIMCTAPFFADVRRT